MAIETSASLGIGIVLFGVGLAMMGLAIAGLPKEGRGNVCMLAGTGWVILGGCLAVHRTVPSTIPEKPPAPVVSLESFDNLRALVEQIRRDEGRSNRVLEVDMLQTAVGDIHNRLDELEKGKACTQP